MEMGGQNLYEGRIMQPSGTTSSTLSLPMLRGTTGTSVHYLGTSIRRTPVQLYRYSSEIYS